MRRAKGTPPQKATCASCAFYAKDDGTCRRDPPITYVMRWDDADHAVTGWPEVAPHEWCGAFALALPYHAEYRAAVDAEAHFLLTEHNHEKYERMRRGEDGRE